MQNVFKLTNKYIILATPLILYSLLSSVYLAISASNGKVINLIFALCLFVLMTGAFIAGWFSMIKTAIQNPDSEDTNSLIKEFPAGVGEYFLPSLGFLLVVLLLSILSIFISYHIGMHFIGDTGISAESLSKALENTNTFKTYLLGLTEDQLIKISSWNLLILCSISITYFLTFLYLPTLFFKNKNPFIAIFISLKDLFSKHFFKTAVIFLLIFVINFLLSIFSTIFGANTILHFVATLMNFYFITAVGVGVFYYYNETFIESQIGQNVDIQI